MILVEAFVKSLLELNIEHSHLLKQKREAVKLLFVVPLGITSTSLGINFSPKFIS